nr:hypothetical protein Iba_chr11dCG6370 [Ipomoea batatas]
MQQTSGSPILSLLARTNLSSFTQPEAIAEILVILVSIPSSTSSLRFLLFLAMAIKPSSPTGISQSGFILKCRVSKLGHFDTAARPTLVTSSDSRWIETKLLFRLVIISRQRESLAVVKVLERNGFQRRSRADQLRNDAAAVTDIGAGERPNHQLLQGRAVVEENSYVANPLRFSSGTDVEIRDGRVAGKYGGNVRGDVSSHSDADVDSELAAAEGFHVVPSPTDKGAVFAVVGS